MSQLEVHKLNKHFGSMHAVKDVSFTLSEGSVFGLIGRNGAGKTTTIRMIMNIIGPDSGEIRLDGRPVGNEFRRRISYLPEERGLYKKMKVMDVLNFFMEIKGIKPAAVRAKALEYLERFDLADRQDAKIEELSKGNQQKIQFIVAILSDPDFLILDEPFSGLDPINTDHLKDIILELKQAGKAIIFSTHLMDFAERMCDQIALIHKGELKLNGSLHQLKKDFAQRNITLEYEGDISFLNTNPMIESVSDYGNATGISVYQESDIQTVLQLLVEHRVVVKRFNVNEISLQEIFLKVAGNA